MRSKSSARWLGERHRDPFVQKAQRDGYRSRAVYKLKELQEKYKLFGPGGAIIDLGAAPGAWTQYLLQILKQRCKIIAVDKLVIVPMAGSLIVHGDIGDPHTQAEVFTLLGDDQVAWVISDMAPNFTGIATVDQLKSVVLLELTLEFAQLCKARNLLLKAFQGVGFEEFMAALKLVYRKVLIRKPLASRSRSSEVYLIARDLLPTSERCSHTSVAGEKQL